jgi:hypothetical protein
VRRERHTVRLTRPAGWLAAQTISSADSNSKEHKKVNAWREIAVREERHNWTDMTACWLAAQKISSANSSSTAKVQ